MKYSSLILFYFIISFELLSMEIKTEVKTSSSLGDLEKTLDEEVIINTEKKSKSLRNSGNFQNLNLENIELDFADKYGNKAIKKIKVDPETLKVIMAAHKQLVNNIQNPDPKENHIQNKLPNSDILANSKNLKNQNESNGFNFAKYQIIIAEEAKIKKDISPATSKRLKHLTTGSIDFKKLKQEKIKNGHNAKKNGANEKNGEIN